MAASRRGRREVDDAVEERCRDRRASRSARSHRPSRSRGRGRLVARQVGRDCAELVASAEAGRIPARLVRGGRVGADRRESAAACRPLLEAHGSDARAEVGSDSRDVDVRRRRRRRRSPGRSPTTVGAVLSTREVRSGARAVEAAEVGGDGTEVVCPSPTLLVSKSAENGALVSVAICVHVPGTRRAALEDDLSGIGLGGRVQRDGARQSSRRDRRASASAGCRRRPCEIAEVVERPALSRTTTSGRRRPRPRSVESQLASYGAVVSVEIVMKEPEPLGPDEELDRGHARRSGRAPRPRSRPSRSRARRPAGRSARRSAARCRCEPSPSGAARRCPRCRSSGTRSCARRRSSGRPGPGSRSTVPPWKEPPSTRYCVEAMPESASAGVSVTVTGELLPAGGRVVGRRRERRVDPHRRRAERLDVARVVGRAVLDRVHAVVRVVGRGRDRDRRAALEGAAVDAVDWSRRRPSPSR